MLTADRVREVLSYDPISGILRWKAPSCDKSYIKVGSIAGSKTVKGYLNIMIDGERHPAHRLIWLMVTGSWPKNLMDHKNGNKSDNRWENLREANDSQNKANCGPYKGSLSGLKGAYYVPKRTSYKKWQSSIRKDGKLKNLGYFATPEEAHNAYAIAAAKLHGSFMRLT
jgi:hypothetical protein